nr:MAG TPA: hypothetical protein [Bacteriophage sp.]
MVGQNCPIKKNAERSELQIVLPFYGSRYPHFMQNLFEKKQ